MGLVLGFWVEPSCWALLQSGDHTGRVCGIWRFGSRHHLGEIYTQPEVSIWSYSLITIRNLRRGRPGRQLYSGAVTGNREAAG